MTERQMTGSETGPVLGEKAYADFCSAYFHQKVAPDYDMNRALYAAFNALAPHVAALVEQARADEREKMVYRDADDEELVCPRCGGPDPEGYTRKVLES